MTGLIISLVGLAIVLNLIAITKALNRIAEALETKI